MACVTRQEWYREWQSKQARHMNDRREVKTAIRNRDGQKCFYCDEPNFLRQLTIDHILPRSKGGTDDFDNLVLACCDCNKRKGVRAAEAFLMQKWRERHA